MRQRGRFPLDPRLFGTGAAGQPLGMSLLAAMGLGIALAACVWWTYFDADDTRG